MYIAWLTNCYTKEKMYKTFESGKYGGLKIPDILRKDQNFLTFPDISPIFSSFLTIPDFPDFPF